MTTSLPVTARLQTLAKKHPFLSGFAATLLLSLPCMLCFGIFAFLSLPRNEQMSATEQTAVLSTTAIISTTAITTTAPITPAMEQPAQVSATSPPPPATSTSAASPNPTSVPTRGGAYPQPTRGGAYPQPTRGGAYPQPTRGAAYPQPTQAVASTPIAASPATPAPVEPDTDTSDQLAESAGLGLQRSTWEEQQGPPQSNEGNLFQYHNGAFMVQYQQDIIIHLERHWSDKDAVPIEDARQLASRFIPSDSEFVTQVLQDSESQATKMIEHHQSAWLSSRFNNAANLWGEGQPGDFSVIYHVVDDRTRAFIITTGHIR
jgi:hypothetical protein